MTSFESFLQNHCKINGGFRMGCWLASQTWLQPTHKPDPPRNTPRLSTILAFLPTLLVLNACDHLWIGDAEAGAPEIDARCSTNMHDPRLLICCNYMQYTRASADSRTPAPLDPEEIRQTWDVLQTSLLGSVRKSMAVFSLGWGTGSLGTGSLGLVFEAWAL